jgi:hypothetical protein
MRHVTYERLQYLHKTHTLARKRRQHLEWVQCLALQLTLILLMWRTWWAPNNASKWLMGFNSAFKGLIQEERHVTKLECYPLWEMSLHQNNYVWQLNVFEYGTTKFQKDVNTPGSETHTHTHSRVRTGDSRVWQVSVVIPFANHFSETTKQVKKVEEGFM